MRHKLYILLVVILLVSGCGSDDGPKRARLQRDEIKDAVVGGRLIPFTEGVQILLETPRGFQDDEEAMTQTIAVIKNRIVSVGVDDWLVIRAGSNQLLVYLPGVREQQAAFEAIKWAGILEFVDFSNVSETIPEGACILTDLQVMLAQEQLLPGETLPPYDQWPCATDDASVAEFAYTDNGQPYTTIMTGAGLEDAAAQPQDQISTSWIINFKLKSTADEPTVSNFTNYVATHANLPLAMVLDGRLLSYPTIQAGLAQSAAAGTMDGGIITGRFTKDEAEILAVQLRSGALPVPLTVIDFNTFSMLPSSDPIQYGDAGTMITFKAQRSNSVDSLRNTATALQERLEKQGVSTACIQVLTPIDTSGEMAFDQIRVFIPDTAQNANLTADVVNELPHNLDLNTLPVVMEIYWATSYGVSE
ncbi:MAG TPA: hypothetical protein VHP83_01665 [Aggregatilineaceae bacterium]|nr:hypothetical protein [Aggregatilineaceae bacterium]